MPFGDNALTDLADPAHWLPGDAELDISRAAIKAYNAERPARVKATADRLAFAVIASLAVGAASLAWSLAENDGTAVFMAITAIIFCGAFAWEWVFRPAREFEQQLRQRLFPVIFGFIADFRYDYGTKPRFLEKFRETGLLDWNKFETDDCFAGVHDGLKFEISEINLFNQNGDGRSNQFSGLIVHIRQKSEFAGLLLAQRKTNDVYRFFRDLFGSELRTVSCGLAEIDVTHEFRTNNAGPEQARMCIEMAKALDWLRKFWDRGPVQIVFDGHDCYLLLATGRKNFELPIIQSGNIDFDRDVLPVMKEMVTLLAIAHLINKIGAPE